MKNQKGIRLSFNAPAVLTFSGLCVIVRLAGMLTNGESDRLLFSVYRSSLLDPLTYVRCITHVLGHADWSHLLNNLFEEFITESRFPLATRTAASNIRLPMQSESMPALPESW